MSDSDESRPRGVPPTIDHEPIASARPDPVQTEPRRRGGSGASILFTLVLFGGLAYGLYYVWTNPQPQPGQDFASLQRKVEAQAQLASQIQGRIDALGQQVQGLADRVDKLEKAPPAPPPSGPPAGLDDLSKRVDDLSAKLDSLAGKPAEAAPAQDNGAQQAIAALGAALGGRIDALAADEKATTGQMQAALSDMRQQQKDALDQAQAQEKQALEAAATQLAGQQKAEIDQATQQDEERQKTAIGQLQQQLSDAQKAALAQLQQQLSGEQKAAVTQAEAQTMAAQKEAMDQQLAAEKATDDALAVRLDRLEQGAGQVESAAARAARLERVQAAVVALQNGQKLPVLPEAPPALARFTKEAPPTEAALRESFPHFAARAREASRPDVSHEGFFDRALTRLQQSVTVRQGNDVVVGDPASGILSAAETKVDLGDLPGAVHALQGLNGPAAAVMQPWTSQTQALIDARAALASLAAHG